MITYSKTSWGLHLLLRVYGSAFPRSLPFSAISTGICAALYVAKKEQVYDDWRHPYPYQAFAFIVGFIVVFRYVALSVNDSFVEVQALLQGTLESACSCESCFAEAN